MDKPKMPFWPRHNTKRYILLFLFLSILYHSNLRPIASADSLAASLVPFSILLDGSISLDRFGPYVSTHVWPAVLHKAGAHWYSYYPVAGPALTTPLYLPVAFIPWIRQQSPATLVSIARITEKAIAVMLAVLAAMVLLALLRRLTSERAAWMLTVLFALGTGNWSTSSQALWQHTYGQLAIIGCLYSIERLSALESESKWYLLAGVSAGCALAIRPANVALVAALALVLPLKRARTGDYFRVLAPLILIALPIAAYNFSVFQSATGGYPAKLEGQFFEGLAGILLSPGRGLFFYTPIAVFALAAFTARARRTRAKHRLVVIAATVFSLFQIAFISMWPVWWGGYCWGPRLLTEVLGPIMTLIAVGLPAIKSGGWKWAFAGVSVYCCLIQAIGVYCYPKGRWDHLPVSVNAAPARLWSVEDNPVMRTARAGVAWEPYSIITAWVTGGPPAAAKKLQQLGINPY